MLKTKTNIEVVKELARELYFKYNDYYYSVIFEILVEAVDNSITDLHGVCDIEDLHKNITENYI